MRSSQFLLSTLKETPADAEIISHQLMLRAGMIRRLAAGIYSWLPLGLKVLRKVEQIVRDEMDRAGAQELLMPTVQPAELWQESGRWEQYGPELLRFTDRHQREFCFGPTHEEVITSLIRNEIRSYRQLPANFYQIQTKFRDEIRPRFGVMRSREFVMKDAYSFHADEESLQVTYDQMHQAYSQIFSRIGLTFRSVEADSGSIGGTTSHEFHVLADSGEDAIAICEQHHYAASVELAPTLPNPTPRAAATQKLTTVDTPGQYSIEEVATFLGVDPTTTIKTLLVRGTKGVVALVLRGDHELNTIKAEKHKAIQHPLEFVSDKEVVKLTSSKPGSIGPVGLTISVIVDFSAAALADFVCGANKDDKHLTGVNWERDLPIGELADLRKVVTGDPCPLAESNSECGDGITIKRGIEVGHIFQLGTKYSDSMNASCLDANGKAVILTMGCYGIGISRIVAATIEQNHDDNGIIWPDSIAPFDVALIPIGLHKSAEVKEAVESIYQELSQAGFDCLLDDRNERPGVMFADTELIGIPHRLVLGKRSLEQGMIEYKHRQSKKTEEIPLAALIDTLKSIQSPITD